MNLRKRIRRQGLTASMQALEPRLLLAASFISYLNDGTMVVTGTPGDDNIRFAVWLDEASGQIVRTFFDVILNQESVTYVASSIRIVAGGGNDTINCIQELWTNDWGTPSPAPFAAYIDGGDGDDRITANVLADTIEVGAGNDVVWANDGADKVVGGDGDDTLSGGAQKDHLDGGAGNDRLNGNGGHDRLFGGPNADRLFGYEGNDWLEGGSSNDRLEGGNGSDTMFGAGGNDRFFAAGDSTIDEVFGGKGDDTAIVDASDLLASVEIHV